METEGMNSPNVAVGRGVNAEAIQSATKFPRTLATVRKTGYVPRRMDLLYKELRHLYRERLGLAATRPGRTTQCPVELWAAICPSFSRSSSTARRYAPVALTAARPDIV